MTSDKPSQCLIEQRIRNRILEYFDLVSSYENDPPFDMNELINFWEDWVSQPFENNEFAEPVYSKQELLVLKEFNDKWRTLCDFAPKTITDKEHVLASDSWKDFVRHAKHSLETFSTRGILPEDQGIGK
jgi:hypothetical protein